MLAKFFNLNPPYLSLTSSAFINVLASQTRISGIEVKGGFGKVTIKDKEFSNISFSKQEITECTFHRCRFEDCLFIGTTIRQVQFHNCEFVGCNFYKVRLHEIYAKPFQFKMAISDKNYANIAVHLYQQLSSNYQLESQRNFKNEAEYQFRRWSRINDLNQSRRTGSSSVKYSLVWFGSWVYDLTFGYGYRLRNLVCTTLFTVSVMMGLNYYLSPHLFSNSSHADLMKTTYFTLTTMATLGASGYQPDTEFGYGVVIVNVLVGISLWSAAITAIMKKVTR